ncbi:aldose 1-epimerase [Paraferrimonas sp. SM1919]|uniref:aldose 1-epimerase n=1 Tax=Paraferrimonas sp. SM1919 TaxID=2662263 RepID=UPI0013D23962|nr:aldose 1-epimerase [Paraferrimonas sp. SM1919]
MNTITLQDEFAVVTIAPELGARILCYRHRSHSNQDWVDIVPNAIAEPEQLTNTAFPLVPFSNRIKDGQFNWQGQAITLMANLASEPHAIHGHGWQQNWQISTQSRDSLELIFSYKAADWPFSYQCKYFFKLVNGNLTQTLTLKNTGSAAMPFGLGFHPYFIRTDKVNLQAQTTGMWHVDEAVLPSYWQPTSEAFSFNQGAQISSTQLDNLFTGLSSNIVINWPEFAKSLTIKCSDNCKFMVVYSPLDAGYFCVEPVTQTSNAFNADIELGKNEYGVLQANETDKIDMHFLIN